MQVHSVLSSLLSYVLLSGTVVLLGVYNIENNFARHDKLFCIACLTSFVQCLNLNT